MGYLISVHFREITGLTISELARKTGLSERLILKVEHGKHPVPLTLIKFYSSYFNIKLSFLLAIFRQEFSTESERVITVFFQKIILNYLNASKWMESFYEEK